jgi:hypothetical protein
MSQPAVAGVSMTFIGCPALELTLHWLQHSLPACLPAWLSVYSSNNNKYCYRNRHDCLSNKVRHPTPVFLRINWLAQKLWGRGNARILPWWSINWQWV